MVRWLRVAAAAVALAVVTACTPAATTTAPTTAASSAQPTYLCTASSQTASPFPCDKARYDEQQKTKALEDEAKAVYERYWKEYMRLTAAGGASEATPELRATVSDSFLPTIMALLKFQSDNKIATRTLKQSLALKVASSDTVPESLVTIVGCEDTRGSVFVDSTGKVFGNGSLSQETRFFKRDGGSLKMFAGRGVEVTQC